MTDDVDGRNCNIVLLPASFQSEKGAKNINVPVHGLLLSLLSHNSPRSGTNCTMPKMSCSKNGKKRRTDFFSTANAFKKPRRHEGNPPTHYRSLNVDRSQCDKAGGLSLLSSDDGSITSDAGDADEVAALLTDAEHRDLLGVVHHRGRDHNCLHPAEGRLHGRRFK